MLKFILEKDQREIKKEYVQRFLVFFFLFFSLVWLAGVLLLVPSFWSLIQRKSFLEEQLFFYQESDVALQIQDLDLRIKQISPILSWFQNDDIFISDYLKKIIDQIEGGIKINSISFVSQRNENENKILVEISGNSPERENMLIFSKNLEEQGFESVTVPYSNLTTKVDIPFSTSFFVSLNKENESDESKN